MSQYSILSRESTASIREIQTNPSLALKGIVRITCAGKQVGIFFDNIELTALFRSLGKAQGKTISPKSSLVKRRSTKN